LDLTGDFCFSGERDTVLSGGCLKKVFLFSSVSDPHWIPDAIRSWIRIRIQEGKNEQQNRKKSEISCFEGLIVLF
jgi:hypothetical protein